MKRIKEKSPEAFAGGPGSSQSYKQNQRRLFVSICIITENSVVFKRGKE